MKALVRRPSRDAMVRSILERAAFRPIHPVSVGRRRGLVSVSSTGCEYLRYLKERRRTTWAGLVINDIGMSPLVELEDWAHFWQHADPALFWRRQNVIAKNLGEKAAELKHPNLRWIG